MRVLVTGASGFIGSNILQPLVLHGHDVIALCRSDHHANLNTPGITWKRADIFSASEMQLLINQVRPEGLVHCAWTTEHGHYWHDPDNIRWVAASLNLFREFSRYGKRLMVLGTSAEYAWGTNVVLDEQTSRLAPDTLYGVCKNSLRQVVEKWTEGSDVSFAWARIFNVFGAEENERRLIPRVIHSLIKNQPMVFDDCSAKRDFMNVSEAGSALSTLFTSEVAGPVNIASGTAVSIRELIESIANYLHKLNLVEFDPKKKANSEEGLIVASTRRLEQEVGWQSKISFEEQLVNTIEWWKTKINNQDKY